MSAIDKMRLEYVALRRLYKKLEYCSQGLSDSLLYGLGNSLNVHGDSATPNFDDARLIISTLAIEGTRLRDQIKVIDMKLHDLEQLAVKGINEA